MSKTKSLPDTIYRNNFRLLVYSQNYKDNWNDLLVEDVKYFSIHTVQFTKNLITFDDATIKFYPEK